MNANTHFLIPNTGFLKKRLIEMHCPIGIVCVIVFCLLLDLRHINRFALQAFKNHLLTHVDMELECISVSAVPECLLWIELLPTEPH